MSAPTEAGPAQSLPGPVQNKILGPLFRHDDSVPDRDRRAVSHSAFRARGDAAGRDCPAPCPGDPVGGFLLELTVQGRTHGPGPKGAWRSLSRRGSVRPSSAPVQRDPAASSQAALGGRRDDSRRGPLGCPHPPPACVALLVVGNVPEAAPGCASDRSAVCGLSTAGAFTGHVTPRVPFRASPRRQRTAAPGPHGSASCPGSAASGLPCKGNHTADSTFAPQIGQLRLGRPRW